MLWTQADRQKIASRDTSLTDVMDLRWRLTEPHEATGDAALCGYSPHVPLRRGHNFG